MTTSLVTVRLLFLGKAATASERLFEAMGMAKLQGGQLVWRTSQARCRR
jgi:hypothetical protein